MHLTPKPEHLHPYASLTPDVVLDALSTLGLHGDGRLLALGSYENRVYQVHLEDGQKVVAKFYRPGRWSQAQLQEEHEFAQLLQVQDVPVVAPLVLNGTSLHAHAGFTFSVTPWRGGRRPELDDAATLEWIGRFLGRLHTVGAQHAFAHRARVNSQTLGWQAREEVLQSNMLPAGLDAAWAQTSEQALQTIDAGQHTMSDWGALLLQDAKVLRLHGDCHPGNILWTPPHDDIDPEDEAALRASGAGPHFVDLDDAAMGPAVQDLWMLLSGDRTQQTRQLGLLIDGYEQVRDFDRRELSLIEPLRTLRVLHYSAWLAKRWDDPTFPHHFPWFGTPAYWEGQIRTLQEQCQCLQQPVLCA